MLLADSNVWLALAISKHEHHGVVRDWLAEQNVPESLLFCRSTQQSFLRLLTTRAILDPYEIPPMSNKAAWSIYEGYVADHRVTWVAEPRDLESHWKLLAANAKPSPKLWMDSYLAAFAMAGGYQLVTTDSGFRQFKSLDLIVLK
jgi:toxin-antitoxin system PIN domain toxin